MTNKPHFLTDPLDPAGQAFRADCMAWELFTKKPKAEREAFIAGQPALQTAEFSHRLRRCETWWMLTYLNWHLIEEDLAELPEQQQRQMRSDLESMRKEIKLYRQRKLKTAKGSKAYA